MTPKPISLLIVDDHPMIRDGLSAMVRAEPAFSLAGQAGNGNQAVELYRKLRPDIVLMDLRMPECSGVRATKRIRVMNPKARIVILTSFDAEEDIFTALQAGAHGYILKDACREDLIRCIWLAAQGKRTLPPHVAAKLAERIDRNQLSQRELHILRFVALGKSNKLIGVAANVSEGTVKFHVKNILAKLGAANRIEAVNIASRRGLLQVEGRWVDYKDPLEEVLAHSDLEGRVLADYEDAVPNPQ